MRKITYLFLTVFLGILSQACIDDDTNTEFTQLNEVTIEGIEDEYNSVYINQVLSIHPTINTTFNDESQLEYLWIAYNINSRYSADTLAHTKNLDAVIGLTPGQHTGKFKVFDLTTDIYYEKEFTINVVNEFTEGLLILADHNNQAELSFWIPSRDELIADVFGLINNGKSLGKNPKRVYFNEYYTDETNEVMVFCQDGEGGKILDNLTLEESRNYKELFINDIGEANPQAYYKNWMRDYLIDNGLAYDRAVNSNPPSSTVKPYLTSPKGDYYIAENADFGDEEDQPSRTVLYDNLNYCFYALINVSTGSLTTVASWGIHVDGGYFNPDNVGMPCIYANITARNTTGSREYLGVFEAENGERHVLRMSIGIYSDEDPSTFFRDIGNDIVTAEGFAEANTFACSANYYGYLFYANGSKIYVYNVLNKTSQALYDFGNGYEIDHIEIERNGTHLWVGYRNTQLSSSPAGFAGLTIQTDGGLQLGEYVRHDAFADRIVDFESKY